MNTSPTRGGPAASTGLENPTTVSLSADPTAETTYSYAYPTTETTYSSAYSTAASSSTGPTAETTYSYAYPTTETAYSSAYSTAATSIPFGDFSTFLRHFAHGNRTEPRIFGMKLNFLESCVRRILYL
jgi:hypothetical protein